MAELILTPSFTIVDCILRDADGEVVGSICPKCLIPPKNDYVVINGRKHSVEPRVFVLWGHYEHLCKRHFEIFKKVLRKNTELNTWYDIYRAWQDISVRVSPSKKQYLQAIDALRTAGAIGDESYKAEIDYRELYTRKLKDEVELASEWD